MLIRYLMICSIMSFAVITNAEPADSTLATYVQTAKAIITGQDNSHNDLQGLARHLLLAADSNPTDPIYAQGVYLAQVLLDSLDECARLT